MTPRIITLCVSGFPGTDRALLELQHACGLSRHITLSMASPDDPAVQFLIDYVISQQPAWVILGSWSTLYEPFITGLAGQGIRYGVYWTSSVGQVEIGGEANTLLQILDDTRLSARLFVTRSLAEGLHPYYPGVFHLPTPLGTAGPLGVDTTPSNPPAISLFCSPHEYKRKNVLNCLLALGMVKSPYLLHVNGLSRHPLYGALLARLKIPYEDHGWMSTDVYQRVLASMDLGLQVSFSESFGYVVAEHLLLGIPVLTSPMVPATQELSAEVRSMLVVAEPDRAESIAATLDRLLADTELRQSVGLRARDELDVLNLRTIDIARHTLAVLNGQP